MLGLWIGIANAIGGLTNIGSSIIEAFDRVTESGSFSRKTESGRFDRETEGGP